MRADQPILRFTLMGLISGSSFVFFSCRNVQDEPLMQDQNARATKVEYNVKRSYLLSDEGLIQALSSIIKTSSIARKAALIQNLSKTRVAEYSGTAVRSIAIPLPGGLYYLTYAKSDKVMRREGLFVQIEERGNHAYTVSYFDSGLQRLAQMQVKSGTVTGVKSFRTPFSLGVTDGETVFHGSSNITPVQRALQRACCVWHSELNVPLV